ncbi:putative transcriptional regulator with HTH domain [Belliella baltica DSM 15883]|uniref:Putative transcriptional regulator with HTH domain n=1 Tax=Belliella baltica (strain DSM 15883 / CIP 108006 / LMG 21964 / BA134) TaxID=866536 RepID=I3Z192_BELBD|nr:ATP-binding protein [Belliella baltica]AFL83010.1 putative transcriptional regulator with HTH domain [Belliella baltica DSM 15883]
MSKKQYTHKELMQLAIDVMNKSVNEPREDGKVPPKVGAVLLFPDGRVETAYRGELREGDHAEFTLLERKLANENVADCILYTTLEPCVERNPPKVPCCRRVTNARIKKVFIGIEDKDPKGNGIRHLEKHSVEYKMFDREFQRIIEEENKVFLKQALQRKIEAEQEEDLRTPFELPVANYDSSKFSDEALRKFIKEANLDFKPTDEAFLEYLSDFGAMELDKEKKKYVPTGYGILLFGKNPRAKFKNAVLKAHVSYGSSKIEPKDFDQALVLLPDQIEEWLKKVLPLSKDTSGFKRKDVPDFPIEVLREAIVNALVHRDYEIEGAKCEIKIDEDKIIVTSPGKPLPAISLEELNTFEAPSLSRNHIITYAFSLMDYVEEKGFGMKTFKSLNKEHGLPIPKYTFKEPFLTLTFPRTIEGVKELSIVGEIEELDDQELSLFELFRNKKYYSKSEFVEQTGIASRTAERMLKRWVELNLLRKEGGGKYLKYVINE